MPHFNHAEAFARFLPELTALGVPIIVVDDGSDAAQRTALSEAVAAVPLVHLILNHPNGGKGAALKTGFAAARERGFTHAVQIDADGQHCAADIERFIELSRAQPDAIICGRPVFDESAPKVRLYGRKVTDFWVALETWSFAIKDGLCGFRVYPLAPLWESLRLERLGDGMTFDTEVLVRALWAGCPLQFADTRVHYPDTGTSHFHYLRDNARLIGLHTRLMLGMVPRAPRLAWRALGGGR